MLPDVSPFGPFSRTLSLSPNKAKVRFDTLLFDARFIDDVLSIERVFLIAIMSDFTDLALSRKLISTEYKYYDFPITDVIIYDFLV